MLTGLPRSGYTTTYTTLQQLTVLPAEKCSIRAIGCHHSRVNRALNTLPREATKLPFPKVDRAYGVKQTLCWEKQANKEINKKPNSTHTTHKKNPEEAPHHYSYWISLCSPIAAHRASTFRGKQGTDVGWLKNLSLPLFYWLVTTEKFALIYSKSKWLDLHKTGGKSQFLMRTLNKDSV